MIPTLNINEDEEGKQPRKRIFGGGARAPKPLLWENSCKATPTQVLLFLGNSGACEWDFGQSIA